MKKVRDQHVGGPFLVHLHGALAVRNGFHFVTFTLQRNAEGGPHVIVVVGHQNAGQWERSFLGMRMLFCPANRLLI